MTYICGRCGAELDGLGIAHSCEVEIARLRAEVERVQRCAICGTGQPHRKLTDDEVLVAKRIAEFGAAEDRAWDECERWRRLCEMVDEHYSGSLDHQPAYVKAIRSALDQSHARTEGQ